MRGLRKGPTLPQPAVERYGYEEQAERLRETIVSLCSDQGFYEYDDPTTGFGHGPDLFSWTAAFSWTSCLKTNFGEQVFQKPFGKANRVGR
jgi:hypothetical protein